MRRKTERFIAWLIVIAALAAVGGITWWVWTKAEIGSTKGEINDVSISDDSSARIADRGGPRSRVSLRVDVVSGATTSSKALLKAIENGLTQ
ncbi:MAG: FMN-binding protein [Spirochaetaceae bacterium]|nr:MAG: FMN-binding protein [Spirochaetaceae bacterium]